jgi:hypothetical protein
MMMTGMSTNGRHAIQTFAAPEHEELAAVIVRIVDLSEERWEPEWRD